MVYRISVSESIRICSMLKVAIIERFYRCMCMCKIIESMLTQCIREREKGKIEIRPEKA